MSGVALFIDHGAFNTVTDEIQSTKESEETEGKHPAISLRLQPGARMPKPIRPLPLAIAKERYKAYSIEVTVKPAGRRGYVQDVSFKVRRTAESRIDYAGALGRGFESAAGATFAALANARNWIDEQRT
jgi:hypothetical protein